MPTRPLCAASAVLAILFSGSLAAADPIVAISDAERGSFVTVEGDVTRILDEDTFRLTDASGNIRVYVGPNRLPVRPGDRVAVTGFVDDDLGPREIYADTIVTADGTTVTLERRYD